MPDHTASHRTPATALVLLRTGGKSRLSGALDPQRRAGLVLAMFDDVLDALLAAGLVDVRVLAADAQAAAAATQRGLSAILDPVGMEPTLASAAAGSSSDARLRRAVDAGLHGVGDTGVRLVVAADLPLLRAKDVEAVLASAADVTVARTRGGGTALLRLGRSVVIPTCYGHGSAEAHLATARARGLSTDSLDLCGAHSDVDGADDLHALSMDGPQPIGRATASFLAAGRG